MDAVGGDVAESAKKKEVVGVIVKPPPSPLEKEGGAL